MKSGVPGVNLNKNKAPKADDTLPQKFGRACVHELLSDRVGVSQIRFRVPTRMSKTCDSVTVIKSSVSLHFHVHALSVRIIQILSMDVFRAGVSGS